MQENWSMYRKICERRELKSGQCCLKKKEQRSSVKRIDLGTQLLLYDDDDTYIAVATTENTYLGTAAKIGMNTWRLIEME